MPAVTLYTRQNCCLCDDAKAVLAEARTRTAFEYREVDIDSDAELRRLYNDDIPVIAIDGAKAFQHRVALQDLLERLAAHS
jgi:glutaredoxin